MNRHKCNAVLFSIGACGYGLIEIIWRGYTHWSMLGAGGLSFLGLSSISERMHHTGRIGKVFAGCGLITGIEYLFGLLFNVVLKKNVWDYSRLPLNLGGQICALYSFFWLILSAAGIPVAGHLRRCLMKQNKE